MFGAGGDVQAGMTPADVAGEVIKAFVDKQCNAKIERSYAERGLLAAGADISSAATVAMGEPHLRARLSRMRKQTA
jgi:hypothetical protein